MSEVNMTVIRNIVRIGTVSSSNAAERTVRVNFADKNNLVSGSLKVLENSPFIPAGGVLQETEPREGGTGIEAFEKHTHEMKISPWFPSIGQMVLCIYLPNSDGDGFVIGGV